MNQPMSFDESTAAPRQTAAEEHAILSAVLNTVIDAIITIDEWGIIQQVNAAACRMFQYVPDELLGKNISMLMPSPDRENHDQYIRDYVTTGYAVIIGIGREVEAVKKDGTLFVADLAVSEVTVGPKRMFTGVLRDMTARIEAEDALIREKNFAKNLVETSNAVILLLNPAGQIVHMNPFMEHLTGYALAEISGQDWFDLFIPEDDRDAIRARFFKTVAGHPQDSFIATIITKDQARRVITWSSRRLFQADGLIEEGVLAIGTDVTELKQAEEKLIQSERLAAIGQMVTGLAHESRNALQRSRACLDMLELDVGSNADQLDLVQRIQQALTELQRLYEEVRNYAAPLKLEPEQCDLLSLVRETWELLREHPQHATLQLVCNDSHAASLCYCDQLRLQQVLRNIFENTLAVSPENGQIQVECSPTILFGFSAFELRIQDDGPGLTEEQARRIFDPFYTTKTKGTGLGMAIAKRIIESHGGYISTSPSVPGRGAEIVIVLPQQPILE